MSEYELSPKEEYVEGNLNHWHRLHSLHTCLMEAERWLKRAEGHTASKSEKDEIKALKHLVKSAHTSRGIDWLKAHDGMRAAQEYMWEHFNSERGKAKKDRDEEIDT